MQTIATPAAWLWFAALIIGLLALDLGLHRQSRGNWFPRSAHVESGVDWVGAALQQLRLSQVREQTSTGVSGRLCLRTEEQRMGSNVRRRLLKRRQLRLQSQIFYRHGTRDACGACGVPHWSISRRHAPVSLLVGLHGLLLFGLPHGS